MEVVRGPRGDGYLCMPMGPYDDGRLSGKLRLLPVQSLYVFREHSEASLLFNKLSLLFSRNSSNTYYESCIVIDMNVKTKRVNCIGETS